MAFVAKYQTKQNHPPPFHPTKIFSTAGPEKGKTTFIWQKNLSLLALLPHHETK
jgi:hypothetical protein